MSQSMRRAQSGTQHEQGHRTHTGSIKKNQMREEGRKQWGCFVCWETVALKFAEVGEDRQRRVFSASKMSCR